MRLNLLFFAAGICLLQQMAELPSLYLAFSLLPLFLFARKFPLWFPLFFLACGFFYAALFAAFRLSEILPPAWEGRDVEITGVVSEMPQASESGQTFSFEVEKVVTPGAVIPRKIRLSTYGQAIVHAGERWRFTAKLKRPHGNANPYGFDYEVWLIERGFGATGYLRSPGVRLQSFVLRPGTIVEFLREKIRDRILSVAPQSGVLAALAVGDQKAISEEDWRIYRRSGVIHLMSISGFHVTMVAGLFSAIVYFLWRRFPRFAFPARKAAAIAAMLAAFAYSLLAGFSVPTQRTLYMLSVVAAALLSGRISATSGVLLSSLTVVLLFDPWAVFSPGFWLSFGAVALIFYVTQLRCQAGRFLWLKVQWAVTVGLVPGLLFLFHQVSLVSPFANALAIPVVSLVVVPLTLFGAIFPFDFPLKLASMIFSLCHGVLEKLASLPSAVWEQHAPPAWTLVPALLGVLWLLAPKGFSARGIGFFGLLPLFLSAPLPPDPGELRFTVLDVGQGLAVVMQTRNHALLFDAGPPFGTDTDSGNRIVVPFLQGSGMRRLDGMILSHADSDHVGGALSVFAALPVDWLLSSLPPGNPLSSEPKRNIACRAGERWNWDGVAFEILSPEGDEGRENLRSCVLKVWTKGGSALIAADAEKSVERRLIADQPEKLRADLLVVPHHGGMSASSEPFVQAVKPKYAVFSVGYKNRFDHPRAEILSRYREIGSAIYRTDQGGAILADFAKTLTVQSWRQEARHYWYGE